MSSQRWPKDLFVTKEAQWKHGLKSKSQSCSSVEPLIQTGDLFMSANEMIPSVGADGFPAAAHQRSEGGQTAEAEAAQLFSRVRVHVRRTRKSSPPS